MAGDDGIVDGVANTTRSKARRQGIAPVGAPVADEIYGATLQLMARKEFGDLSVADVLAEAGVSRASFYYYFESKFGVLSGLLSRAMDDIFEKVSPFLIPSDGTDAETGTGNEHRCGGRCVATTPTRPAGHESPLARGRRITRTLAGDRGTICRRRRPGDRP